MFLVALGSRISSTLASNDVDGSTQGCTSFVGRQGGAQVVGLEAGACTFKGLVMHEVFHSLGFRHEHQRPDRDQHLTIRWDNVKPSMTSRLAVDDVGQVNTFGEPYDYDSISHASNYLYAVDPRLPTLVAKLGPCLEELTKRNPPKNDSHSAFYWPIESTRGLLKTVYRIKGFFCASIS